MTYKNDRVLSVKELARVEGKGAPYLPASASRPSATTPCISCSAHFLYLTVERSLFIPNGRWYPCQVQDPGRSW